MRKIYLVRHAESADRQAGQSDFERVLTERGKLSIQLLGKFLKQENIFPKSIFSSSAVRAQQTATIIADEILFNGNVASVETLYSGTDLDYLDIVQYSTGSIIIVGHNPSISAAAGKLSKNYVSLLAGQVCVITEHTSGEELFQSSFTLVGPLYK